MDDPNITMEEYIRLEEEKAQKRRKVFNWETAKYGRIWYDEDIHDLRSVKNKFPAIVFNDSLKSNETLSCEPTLSSLNDEIDVRISFDESDDEDYTPTVSCIDDLDFFKDFVNEFPAIVYNDALTIMSTSTHPIIVLSDSYIEDDFSSTNTPDYTPASPDYFPASPGNTFSDRSEDLSKDLLASLTISPFHDDPYIKIMQAYNAISN
ncbi:hypothetical protein Tco_1103112 [Tanacetum coccineum]